MTLTNDERARLAEMRQAAEGAFKGEWYIDARTGERAESIRVRGYDYMLPVALFGRVCGFRDENARHIAQASPDRVLWLLDLVARLAGEKAWQPWRGDNQPEGREPVVLLHDTGRLSIMEWHDDFDDFLIDLGGQGNPTHWMRPAPPPAALPRCSICRRDDCAQDHACE